jgi:hypothetical protein
VLTLLAESRGEPVDVQIAAGGAAALTNNTDTSAADSNSNVVGDNQGGQEQQRHDGANVRLRYRLPLAAVISDGLPGRIKQATRGYGSLDYQLTGYEAADLVRLDILVNGEPVDAFAAVLARDDARQAGITILKRLKVSAAILHYCEPFFADFFFLVPFFFFFFSDRNYCHDKLLILFCKQALATKFWLVKQSNNCARTCSPSAMAATLLANVNYWRNKSEARRKCNNWAESTSNTMYF